jgi:hypothetical protein
VTEGATAFANAMIFDGVSAELAEQDARLVLLPARVGQARLGDPSRMRSPLATRAG